MYGLTLLTAPTFEPVTVAEAKTHARIDGDLEDGDVARWIKAAREYVEAHCSQKLAAQSWRVTYRDWPCDDDERLMAGAIRLPFGPVSAITAVKYYATTGVLTTLVADTDYQVWLEHSPPLVAPAPSKVWPTVQTDKLQAVRVEFTAGYGTTASTIPASLKEAIHLTLTYWNMHRGDGRDPTMRGLPAGALNLLDSVGTGGYA